MKPQRADPVAHSVHDRLLKLANTRKEDFNALLAQYGNERLLYRLTQSAHARRFVLKGASLFVLWLGRIHRPTRDLDLLGSGHFDHAILQSIFQEICAAPVEPDGIIFDPASITVADIREGQEYHGLRVKLRGLLGSARLSVQVDIGFGDAITPPPQDAVFPTLLGMPAPALKVYPRETTIAEKLDAMLELGIKNSRMKDYYDLWTLSHHFSFEGRVLCDALRATLNRRGRTISQEMPTGLSAAFGADPAKVRQWQAFIGSRPSSDMTTNLADVVSAVRDFAGPAIDAVATNRSFEQHWSKGGPWRPLS